MRLAPLFVAFLTLLLAKPAAATTCSSVASDRELAFSAVFVGHVVARTEKQREECWDPDRRHYTFAEPSMECSQPRRHARYGVVTVEVEKVRRGELPRMAVVHMPWGIVGSDWPRVGDRALFYGSRRHVYYGGRWHDELHSSGVCGGVISSEDSLNFMLNGGGCAGCHLTSSSAKTPGWVGIASALLLLLKRRAGARRSR